MSDKFVVITTFATRYATGEQVVLQWEFFRKGPANSGFFLVALPGEPGEKVFSVNPVVLPRLVREMSRNKDAIGHLCPYDTSLEDTGIISPDHAFYRYTAAPGVIDLVLAGGDFGDLEVRLNPAEFAKLKAFLAKPISFQTAVVADTTIFGLG